MNADLDFLDGLDDLDQGDPDYVPESTCHVCWALFGPADTGHCSPITGGCCQNFASNHAFERHLVRDRKDPGRVRCLTVEDMQTKGWQRTGAYDSWRTPPPKNSPWKKAES